MFYIRCDKLTIVRVDNKLKINRTHELFEPEMKKESLRMSAASLLAKPIYLAKLLLTHFTLFSNVMSQCQAPKPKIKKLSTIKTELANGQMLDF